jgi:hypothetical protein
MSALLIFFVFPPVAGYLLSHSVKGGASEFIKALKAFNEDKYIWLIDDFLSTRLKQNSTGKYKLLWKL